MTDKISGGAFKQMVAFGAACIAQQKQTINDLNVFPVPDGDTGTNMCLTIQTAVNELRKAEPATVDEHQIRVFWKRWNTLVQQASAQTAA